MQVIFCRLKRLFGRQRELGPFGRRLQVRVRLVKLAGGAFVSNGGKQLALGHALPDRTAACRKRLCQPDKSGVLRAHGYDKCRFDPDGTVNGGNRRPAADGRHFRYWHKEVVDNGANNHEQAATQPQNFLGFRQLQLLELMHVLAGVSGKLKIPSGRAVPFSQRDVVLVGGREQSTLRFEKVALR
jgi:hypothetical protein